MPATTAVAPVLDAPALSAAHRRYLALQAALDKAMPDQLLALGGKFFRRKRYWRAVSVAFGLRVGCVEERPLGATQPAADTRSSQPRCHGGRRRAAPDAPRSPAPSSLHPKDWGFCVTYRATAPNGASADGDGACTASEKRRPLRATLHNVRAHAHTRAFNRAVSNLVGFGEVSAEEVLSSLGRPLRPAPRRRCPRCRGRMWDNTARRKAAQLAIRAGTRSSRPPPAFQCMDPKCGGAIWPAHTR